MRKKRQKFEEIVAKLRQVDVLVSKGQSVVDAIRSIGVTEVSYYRWRRKFGELKTDQVRRMKELEAENARLRRAVADLTLDKLILKEAALGNPERLTKAGPPFAGAFNVASEFCATMRHCAGAECRDTACFRKMGKLGLPSGFPSMPQSARQESVARSLRRMMGPPPARAKIRVRNRVRGNYLLPATSWFCYAICS